MNLNTNLTGLTIRIADECESIRTIINGNDLDLNSLTTVNKTNLVNAINEVNANSFIPGPKGDPGVDGVDGAPGPQGDPGPQGYNHTGTIRVDYTGITVTDFTAEVTKELPIVSGTPVIDLLTLNWPIDAGLTPSYNPNFFDVTNTRLRENTQLKQPHIWRCGLSYANKNASTNLGLDIELFNPDSGFIIMESITLPDGRTSGLLYVNLISVADSNSSPLGRGYRIRIRSSVTDHNLSVSLIRIMRLSLAVENNVL